MDRHNNTNIYIPSEEYSNGGMDSLLHCLDNASTGTSVGLFVAMKL